MKIYSLVKIIVILNSIVLTNCLARANAVPEVVKTGEKYYPIHGAEVCSLCARPQPAIKLLQVGDIITKYDKYEILGWEQLINLKDTVVIGKARVFFVRNGEEYTIEVEPGYFGIVATDYFDAYRKYTSVGHRNKIWDKYVEEGLKNWMEDLKTDFNFDKALENIDMAIKLGCKDTIVFCAKAFCENMSDRLTADEIIDLYNKCLSSGEIDRFDPYIKNVCFLGLADMYYEKRDIDRANFYAEKTNAYILLKNNFSWRAKNYRDLFSKIMPEQKVDINKYVVTFQDDFSNPHSGLSEKRYKDGRWTKNLSSGYYHIDSYDDKFYDDFIAIITVVDYNSSVESSEWTPCFGFIFTDLGGGWYANKWSGLYIKGASIFSIKNDKWGDNIHSRYINKNGPNILKIVKQDDYAQYYINDKWMATFKLARPYGRSIIGFQTIGSSVVIDDFKVLIKKKNNT